ncbi:unnamed protein product [Arabidopsis lyrata]|nr:unnamed protein product [Arabidopsis lyrata]
MKEWNVLVYHAVEKVIGTIGEGDKGKQAVEGSEDKKSWYRFSLASRVKCKLVVGVRAKGLAFSIGQNEQSIIKYYDLITKSAEFKKRRLRRMSLPKTGPCFLHH